ncbi:ATP-binding cassette domain-containing protein [Oceanispirochaeta sp. M1]|nr:ATP-binding cassette domain-containing protein [Oceanispirochaeta sp. M1]
MVAPRLALKNLTKEYDLKGNKIKAVNSVSLELPPGKITALVGDSGCGKTTLLRILAGLLEPDEGEIHTIPDGVRAGVVFQDSRLLPWKTVEENLLLSLKRTQYPPLDKTKRDERVDEALGLVQLNEWKNSYPRELSGGMAQRISLARALCQKKGFLLMDEPFSALDALSREKLQFELKAIQQKMGNTVLFITHDISEAIFLADKVCVMKLGQITGVVQSNGKNHDEISHQIHKLLGFRKI